MKKSKLLLSVLLVLTMVLSGFAAGGAGGLRVSAAEKDESTITVSAGQEIKIPVRTADEWTLKAWKGNDGKTYYPDDVFTAEYDLILTPVWKSAADSAADDEEDIESEEDLLGSGEGSDESGSGGEEYTNGEGSDGSGSGDGEGYTNGEGSDGSGSGDGEGYTNGEGSDGSGSGDGEGYSEDKEQKNEYPDGEKAPDSENEEGGEVDSAAPAAENAEIKEEAPAAPAAENAEIKEEAPAAPDAENAEKKEEPAVSESGEEPAAEKTEEVEEAKPEESNLKDAPYTVSFDLSGKEGTKPEDQKFTEKGKTVTKPEDPKATGYTFKEWCKDKELTTAYDFTTVVAESFTLYAKWTANTYTVKFDANGGTGTMTDETGFEYDVEKALTKNAFTREEYEFSGWNTKADGSGDPYADEAKVKNLTAEDKATVTLYAQWKSTKKYTVTFDANGRGTAPAAQTVTSGEKATEPAKPTATGYTCNGWYTDKECKSAYDFATAVTADVTLYAGWTANKYTIHFDPNGGTTGSMADMTCTYDVKTNLTKNAFGRGEDWMFIGWNTKADRTGTAYADQAEVLNLTAENNGKITLYAQWKFIYRVIAGANGVVSKLNTQGITFQTNGNAALFTGITVDGVAVNGNLYSAWAGSKGGTFVNLKQDFVKTLSIGTHTINFLYSDGSCSTTFTVNNSNVINPARTGDNSHMALYAALLAGAAVLVGGLVFLRKRYWK